jgi:hypothetical protein
MMKMKVKNAGLFLLMFMVLSMLFSSAAYAAGESMTFEVQGYEEKGAGHYDLTVTNVTKTVDEKTVDERLDAYLVAETPAVVTTLQDGAMFCVYKMIREGDTYSMVGEPLPISGQVKIWVPGPADSAEEVSKTIDASELYRYEVDIPNYLKGCKVTLTDPGYYYVLFEYEAIAGSTEVIIHVEGEGEQTAPPAAPNSTASAKPTASKVLVNGTNTSFDAYHIDGNNYFKLRDLAKVVSGTEKQFEVEWNTEKKAINLISNQPYTAVGGEMAKGDGKSKNASLNTSKIYRDGNEVSLTAYNINGNNYFKLRDIASEFDIGITWDGKTNTVGIDTSQSYTE